MRQPYVRLAYEAAGSLVQGIVMIAAIGYCDGCGEGESKRGKITSRYFQPGAHAQAEGI